MTAPPGHAPALDRDASRTKLAQSTGEVCPDVAALIESMRADGQYISPSRAQAIYEKVMASADADFDFGSYVLTMTRGRRGSVPVDITVGERVVRRQMRRTS